MPTARSRDRILSFDLLPCGDGDDDIFLNRSSSNPIARNGQEVSPDPAKKPSRRKRRNKPSKKRTTAVDESIAENTIKKQGLVMECDQINPSICQNGSHGILLRPKNSGTEGSNPNFDEFHLNCVSSVESRHGNGSFSIGLGEIVSESGVNVEALDIISGNNASTAELRRENGPGMIRIASSISETEGNVEYFNIYHENNAAPVELRQRTVNGSVLGNAETERDDNSVEAPCFSGQWKLEAKGSMKRLETAESLDWNRVMADNSNDLSYGEKLPLKYFLGEIYAGNALQRTTSIGNEINRQRVYNTMFHVPWRCELLIDVGFFVCLDSFLSLLTIMPARILMTIWRFFCTRQFQKPCAAGLSDFGCFVVLACGIASLQRIDISLIYHIIRGQGTIKLYVVYNVLEIFDKLCQSFGGDVVQVLFNSAEGVANCSPENMTFQLMRFIGELIIAVVAFLVHSFILLVQAITLSTCIVAHNNALLALLVSNNFAEVKSNVFKRLSLENIHTLAYHDTIERFHILAFLLFVLAQNILEAEGPWLGNFVFNASMVYMCEIMIDIIKHSFLAKFNEIKPGTYSEFLEALCKQTLNIEPEDGQRSLTFVPLAPACVVIRVVTPIYAAHLPYGPLPWRLLWVFLLAAMTYFMLLILKILVGMGLRLHARWYVNRREKKKHHLD